ncbi:AAA family ATPase [Zoogloea sp.]|uniref:bifunctional aminoglycoside phosphotransferase/ATP-binding protein n=1 Tax=Zoogloea sp. TaxID=49181 RepID=UPI0025D936E1|nr:AAA family ATPase [Zoogloea sp.]MCK6394704.1 AAA family ATPase [Zoogloea sp.]
MSTAPLPDWLARFQARLGAELIETHISWLLLADGFVWKLKKPLSLPFLDYATAEQRRFCCHEELRLNRRFAPGLYLGLEEVDDSGECAVKMRRFAESQRLDHVCDRGGLGPDALTSLARSLHAFHRGAAVADARSSWGEPDAVLAPALDNFATLLTLQPGEARRLARLQAWTQAEFDRQRSLFAARKAGGHIRECHGDLHLGNLVLLDGQVVPFDCIEFNPALRWIDVASELAFTWMDLLDHHRPDLAAWLLSAWLEESGDVSGVPLLRFYAVYKAMVRAKVAALSGNPQGVADYLELAERLTTPPAARLIITHGLSGSGKTVRSAALLMADPAATTLRLRSDVERKRLHGLPALATSRRDTRRGGIYTPEATRLTFAYLAEAAGHMLDAGWSVIVDAAFLKRTERDDFRAIALRHGAAFAILACSAPEDELRRRLEARRGDASEATVAVLEQQLGWMEPLAPDELNYVLPP